MGKEIENVVLFEVSKMGSNVHSENLVLDRGKMISMNGKSGSLLAYFWGLSFGSRTLM